MRLIIPLVMLAFASSVQAQDVIEWSDKRKLTFTDFKKVPDTPLSAERIISNYGIQTKLDSSQFTLVKGINGKVTALFYPNDSWIDESNKTGLQYSNSIFDIYEWASRELRKRLSENTDLSSSGKLSEIGDEINKEFMLILEAYDSETQYGSNLLEQMKWESRITQNLFALSAYCKSCGEQKLN